MTPPTNKKRVSEAPESSAGDDFHILWAARKSLELLSLDTEGLQLVAIEGPAYRESEDIDPDGSQLLGIDLTEYYGGRTFESAKQVVFSQLKYSTRNSNLPWTIPRICEGKKGKAKNSIIGRLATAFRGYYETHGSDAVLEKVKVKLVSNRPAHDDLGNFIAIQNHLRASPGQVTLVQLKKAFGTFSDELDKLYTTSGLSVLQFVDFLSTLDFSDCGTGARMQQQFALIRALASHGSPEVFNQLNSLKQLVWQKMMPEGRNHPEITVEDVLHVFGFSNVDALFPGPPRLERLKHYIQRKQLQKIGNELQSNVHNIICLHGGAGVGKSTLANAIGSILPQGSEVVVYDCWGGGSYDDPSQARHRHKEGYFKSRMNWP